MATITAKYQNQLLTAAGTAIKIIVATNPRAHFVQNASCTTAGVAVQDYGVAMIPSSLAGSAETYTLEAVLNGTHYYATKTTVDAVSIGGTLTMTDVDPDA